MATNDKQREKTRIQARPSVDITQAGDEPWRKYRVRPELIWWAHDQDQDPEHTVGRRIAHCRGQLDNLTVEALSRYTKKFDRDGIARTTLVRYEAGDFLPGARELRILADTFWVPVEWLLLGTLESGRVTGIEHELLKALSEFINERTAGGLPPSVRDHAKRDQETKLRLEIAMRQRWLHEARNPGAGT